MEKTYIELTDNQWDLLGLHDRRVRAKFEERGLTFSDATYAVGGDSRSLDIVRLSAEAFKDAESPGTRRSMKALITKLDKLAPYETTAIDLNEADCLPGTIVYCDDFPGRSFKVLRAHGSQALTLWDTDNTPSANPVIPGFGEYTVSADELRTKWFTID